MPRTLVMGVSTIMAGIAVAAVRDEIRFLPTFLCLLFVTAAQCASNSIFLFNDLRNHHGNSAQAELEGSLIGKEDVEIYGILKMISGATSIFACTIALILASYSGVWTILFGALLFILIYLNVQGSLPLVSTPFGPIITYIVFGPIGVIGTFLLQFPDSTFVMLNWFDIGPAIYMGLSVGFLAAVVHITIEYENFRASLLTYRTSIVTELGRKFSRFCVLLAGVGMWLCFYLMTRSSYCHYPVFDMVVPSLAFITNTVLWWRLGKYSPASKMVPPAKIAIANMFAFATLVLILFLIIGPPSAEIRGY